MTGSFTVKVPATSANLGPGFDCLGLALDLHDEVTASLGEQTSVEILGEGAGELADDEKHLVVRAMRETFDELGAQPAGIVLRCVNRIPQARGLGSSSAAIVAGVTLANALGGGTLSRADELRIAGRIEGHPDNVAPCLLGGFTIAWMSDGVASAVSLAPSPSLVATLLVPTEKGLTAHARAALPAQVPHPDAAFTAGRAALLVHALTQAPELLFEATEDRLHQDYRAPGMPATAALVQRLRAAGVAATVSGAGPSVLALTALPSDFAVGEDWLTLTLAAETGQVTVEPGNICSTFRHAE
ncbi:homoserine kinase [Rhizocola hellebori]|uniref:Homoserine kinase n=1 Tax=Rhizocola hellebori TaxID=1392758 RepID=A0A8J3QIX3_9ACTN|nr:homoserine kinase [Rhizocola hellebori]GIH11700.1 homoserine kinase [Rhizocola hellebori]